MDIHNRRIRGSIQTRNERLLNKYEEKLGVELPDNPDEWKGEDVI
jgi:hypothetical protein